MKVLLVLMLVALARGAEVKELKEGVDFEIIRDTSDAARNLAAPFVYSYNLYLSGQFATLHMHWHPLSTTPENPIEGFKTSLWEQPRRIIWVQEIVDGQLVLVQKEELLDFPSTDVPTWAPRDTNVLPGDHHVTSIFYNLESGIWYEFRALAYNQNGDGPFSGSVRVRFFYS